MSDYENKPKSGKGGSDNQTGGQPGKLSSTQHGILESAIRGRVAKSVEAAHSQDGIDENESAFPKPFLTENRISAEILPDAVAYNPDLDETALLLPGADTAREYRDMLRKALIDADPTHHRQVIDQLAAEQIPIQTASIHLFTPVAIQLGELWCEDEMDFVQVAVASSRLNIIVNQLVKLAKDKLPGLRNGRRIMLARTAGGNHTLGLTIVAACFDDAGWDVEGGAEIEADDQFMSTLKNNDYQMTGLSIGTTAAIDECRDLVKRSREYSKNSLIRTAVGGPAVTLNPNAFNQIGADIVAATALEAVNRANSISW